MPDKDYQIFLGDHAYLVISIRMADGKVVGFVVRLVDSRGSEDRDVARYDTAHGWPHLDILGRGGKVKEKKWLEDGNFEKALRFAIQDFRTNAERYLD